VQALLTALPPLRPVAQESQRANGNRGIRVTDGRHPRLGLDEYVDHYNAHIARTRHWIGERLPDDRIHLLWVTAPGSFRLDRFDSPITSTTKPDEKSSSPLPRGIVTRSLEIYLIK
jgi:hypothetical protein